MGAMGTIFTVFGMTRLGIKPATEQSPCARSNARPLSWYYWYLSYLSWMPFSSLLGELEPLPVMVTLTDTCCQKHCKPSIRVKPQNPSATFAMKVADIDIMKNHFFSFECTSV